MFNVKDFLTKFEKIALPNNIKRDYISSVIFKICNIKIKKSDIDIKNNSIYIKTNNIKKNEIFFNKVNILAEINNNFKESKITNIL